MGFLVWEVIGWVLCVLTNDEGKNGIVIARRGRVSTASLEIFWCVLG